MQNLIDLKNVTKTYVNEGLTYTALKGITFGINKGEMVAIIGPSGSGKSTTMHILGALDSPTSGKYTLNRHDVSKLNDEHLAKIRNMEIGFVFQAFNLLPRTTVLDNVILPLLYSGLNREQATPKAITALKDVGLGDKVHNRSNQLSGGQIQRVAIARAIVTSPAIILADEPTGNLDTVTSMEVMRTFQKMHAEGKTIIIITHEPEIAAFCSRVIALKDGKIVSDKKTKQSKA